LRSHLRQTERLTATSIRGQAGAGRLLRQMVDSVRRAMTLLPAGGAREGAGALPHVLVASLRALPAATTPVPGPPTASHPPPAVPPRREQGVGGGALPGSGVARDGGERRMAPLAGSLARAVQGRAAAARALHLGTAPGGMPTRSRQSTTRAAQHQRNRVRLGL